MNHKFSLGQAVVFTPGFGEVLRGVSFTPGTNVANDDHDGGNRGW